MCIKKLERIQSTATKPMLEMKHLTYEDLREVELPTLQNRREIDLITMYKITNCLEKIEKQDLVSLKNYKDRWVGGHSKIRKSNLRDMKK